MPNFSPINIKDASKENVKEESEFQRLAATPSSSAYKRYAMPINGFKNANSAGLLTLSSA